MTALLAGWPVWWFLGFNEFAPLFFAVPMAMTLYRWRATRERVIRVPPAFTLWLLFLLVSVAGVAAVSQTAPDTSVSPVSNRVISWALRIVLYLGATVVLLYAGNLTEREMPRLRMAWLLGLVGIYTVAGGLLGIAAPHLHFTSPLALLVPKSLQNGNAQIALMLHPGSSQIMSFLGYSEGRPSAPFPYTNMWGNSLAILLPWLLVAWWSHGSRRHRRLALIVFVAALPAVVYSLDRGLWVGIGFAILYLAVRYAARGRLAMLGGICVAIGLVLLLILVTPLGGLIGQRLSHGKSNSGRTSYSLIALEDGLASPVIGYGDTRHAQGSQASIAIGRTSTCHNCGYAVIGGNGQIQLMLVSSGILGAGLYVAFFAYGAWRYRRDPTPYGLAGVLVLWLGFVFMFVYEAVGPPLAFTMIAYALLWRNEREHYESDPAPGPDTARSALPRSGQGMPISIGR